MTTILKPSPRNGMLGWPDNWTLRRYNACNEPCDFLIGPCACGAMHHADEEWVQRALEHYGARIEYPRVIRGRPPGVLELHPSDALCGCMLAAIAALVAYLLSR